MTEPVSVPSGPRSQFISKLDPHSVDSHTPPPLPTNEGKIFSPSKEILPLYFSHLERFQFGEAARVLSLAAVRFSCLLVIDSLNKLCFYSFTP